jgi:hypothetical protein
MRDARLSAPINLNAALAEMLDLDADASIEAIRQRAGKLLNAEILLEEERARASAMWGATPGTWFAAEGPTRFSMTPASVTGRAIKHLLADLRGYLDKECNGFGLVANVEAVAILLGLDPEPAPVKAGP